MTSDLMAIAAESRKRKRSLDANDTTDREPDKATSQSRAADGTDAAAHATESSGNNMDTQPLPLQQQQQPSTPRSNGMHQ
jgi:hypothetical protein